MEQKEGNGLRTLSIYFSTNTEWSGFDTYTQDTQDTQTSY